MTPKLIKPIPSSEWTPLEIEELEDYIGLGLDALQAYAATERPKMKIANGMLLLALRRQMPQIERAEALSGAFKLDQSEDAIAEAFSEEAGDVDPTPSAATGGAEPPGMTF